MFLCFLIGRAVCESGIEEEDLLGDEVHILGEVGEALVHQARLDEVDLGQGGLPGARRHHHISPLLLQTFQIVLKLSRYLYVPIRYRH